MGITKWQRLVVPLAIAATAVAVLSALYWATTSAPTHGPPFLTLYRGDTDYRHAEEDFEGGCIAIRTHATWRAFWNAHASVRTPKPPLPVVDFGVHMVLACFLGWQSSSGPSIEVERIVVSETSYVSYVTRNYTQTQLPAITNSCHIVRVPLTPGPIAFVDADTNAEIPQIPFVP